MPTSYNGWSASPRPSDFGGISPLVVAGEPFSPGVRNGDVHRVLAYVAEQMHRRVEPVVRSDWHQADDWGYNYRANRNNPASLSCHSSGTAIDYNATRHPNGRAGTFSAAQVAEIRRILAEVGNVVRWGGDFSGTKDEMHFEIRGTASQVAAVAARLGGGGKRAPRVLPVLRRGQSNDGWVWLAQGILWVAQDNDFGAVTEDAVRAFQGASGLPVTGVVEQDTWARMLLRHGILREGEKQGYLEVDLLQQFVGVPVDRDFGIATRLAVEEVQRWGNVTVDGEVGPEFASVCARVA